LIKYDYNYVELLQREFILKTKTFNIEEEQLKKLKDLSRRTHIPEAKLIRLALREFLKDEERLKVILGRVDRNCVPAGTYFN